MPGITTQGGGTERQQADTGRKAMEVTEPLLQNSQVSELHT